MRGALLALKITFFVDKHNKAQIVDPMDNRSEGHEFCNRMWVPECRTDDRGKAVKVTEVAEAVFHCRLI